MNRRPRDMKHGRSARPQEECNFIRLYGNTVLGRLLSRKVCDLDRNGSHYDVCRVLMDPNVYTWAFAWGMAFALSKPEWAFQVLSEFHPEWQDLNGEGQWPVQIDEVVRHNPVDGHL